MSDSDIVQDFLVESYENLDRLDRELVGLEKNPHDREALASVFRTIHTIKGTCGFLGFNKLEKVAHVGENLLTRLRDGQLTLNPELTTALLGMVDAVRQMLNQIEASGQEGERDDSVLISTLGRLQQVPGIAPKNGPAVAESSAPAAPPRPIGDILMQRTGVTQAEIQLAAEMQKAGDPRHMGEILVEQGAVRPADVVEALHIQQVSRTQGTASDSTIRVDVGLLDKVMNLVGELVLARNQVLQFASRMKDSGFVAVSQRLNLITTELQEGVMKTRMQPIGNIWGQFPRTVRDVALGCGKEVGIEMEGKETELDKTIIEAIKDPLTHLVRNSVDHGIELPDDRVTAGKARSGRLILRAFHEGGQVNIEISDDGAGLNADRIRKKALERGVATAEQVAHMAEREVFNLIFLPGFSTAEKVTNVSGRGVGMDVVKTNVEKIGGTVDVQSTRGQGTTVRVKIPLTLAIIPALVVTCGGDRYAVGSDSLRGPLFGRDWRPGYGNAGYPSYFAQGICPRCAPRRRLYSSGGCELSHGSNFAVLHVLSRQVAVWRGIERRPGSNSFLGYDQSSAGPGSGQRPDQPARPDCHRGRFTYPSGAGIAAGWRARHERGRAF